MVLLRGVVPAGCSTVSIALRVTNAGTTRSTRPTSVSFAATDGVSAGWRQRHG